MQNFSFAPPNLGVTAGEKNYVFVDEHNRHKRLKVMRACEGCRRRKIKCDSATTNHWPCAACLRLKLQCNPPTVNYDRAQAGGNNRLGMQGVLDFDNSSGGSGDEDYSNHSGQQVFEIQNPPQMQTSHPQYNTGLGPSYTPPYSEPLPQHEFAYNDTSAGPPHLPQPMYHHASFSTPNDAPLPQSGGNWRHEQFSSAADLSDVLGELKINENGVAPYISQQKKNLAETPAYEEEEVKIPSLVKHSGGSVRIPADLMPSDAQCMQYFEIFFAHVHPYVPVISKPYFYQQWNTNRNSISPLILEAIFACAGRMSDDADEGASWLSMARGHEECFMDVPRLSTVQALLILLKARESQPKRGYYFRSWMTVKKLVTMGFDLDLHEHYAEHRAGRPCHSDPTECLVKTRIWQTIFICEIMIGGPQGRPDMHVDPDTVDLEIQRPMPGIDSSDYQVSRQFTYLVRKIWNVRQMHDLKGKAKGKPDNEWTSDPKFIGLGGTLPKWLDDLPRDLQVTFPDDETPPWLPSHFVGNMHTYYHLTLIMLHRPLLGRSSAYADGSWKRYMVVCYRSSKLMCRLQEGIFQTYGMDGLISMQRGINFVIYSVLTCVCVHLVALTSPDPTFNCDARDYFTRHMRLLETCSSAWPQPDMQAAINSLREAFSADTSRPFELKANFPFGSRLASSGLQPSPPPDGSFHHLMLPRHDSHGQIPQQMPYQVGPMTPPISAGLEDPKDRSMAPLTSSALPNDHSQLLHSSMANNQVGWNPAPIFEQWNAAFGEGSAPMAAATTSQVQQSPPLYGTTSLSPESHSLHQQMPHSQQGFHLPSLGGSSINNLPSLSRVQTAPQMPAYSDAPPSIVTSDMWRGAVANTYGKRNWDQQSDFLIDPVQSKRQR